MPLVPVAQIWQDGMLHGLGVGVLQQPLWAVQRPKLSLWSEKDDSAGWNGMDLYEPYCG